MIDDQRLPVSRALVAGQMAEMRLPAARGPMTEMLFAELSRPPHELARHVGIAVRTGWVTGAI